MMSSSIQARAQSIRHTWACIDSCRGSGRSTTIHLGILKGCRRMSAAREGRSRRLGSRGEVWLSVLRGSPDWDTYVSGRRAFGYLRSRTLWIRHHRVSSLSSWSLDRSDLSSSSSLMEVHACLVVVHVGVLRSRTCCGSAQLNARATKRCFTCRVPGQRHFSAGLPSSISTHHTTSQSITKLKPALLQLCSSWPASSCSSPPQVVTFRHIE